MKKLLIIGASVLQLPAIQKAKEKGYYVGVIDYNPNAVGVPYADEFFEVSTIDADGVTEVARSFCPDGIMTLATDMPMRSIAQATRACGLPGISTETALKSTDKGEMIKAFAACDVAHPWYEIVGTADELERIADRVTYPCIMKPTDNSGSRGVVLVKDRDMLTSSYEYTHAQSRSGGVIVEEYLCGNEVSVEIMVTDGEPKVLQITDKLTTGAPHFVEMGHSQPSRLPDEAQKEIDALACSAVRAVGIGCGPAHVEIMMTENGPKMIELGARMGGDCITTHLVPLSTGIDMVSATMDVACGMTPDITQKIWKGSAIRYFNPQKGVIKSIKGLEEARAIEGVREITLVKAVGDSVGSIGSSTDRAGFVIAQADTPEEAVRICERACETIRIETES